MTFFFSPPEIAAIVGVAAYNNHKLKKEATKQIPNASEDAELEPMVAPSSPHR